MIKDLAFYKNLTSPQQLVDYFYSHIIFKFEHLGKYIRKNKTYENLGSGSYGHVWDTQNGKVAKFFKYMPTHSLKHINHMIKPSDVENSDDEDWINDEIFTETLPLCEWLISNIAFELLKDVAPHISRIERIWYNDVNDKSRGFIGELKKFDLPFYDFNPENFGRRKRATSSTDEFFDDSASYDDSFAEDFTEDDEYNVEYIIFTIVFTLAALHRYQFSHNDVKPENVMLEKSKLLKKHPKKRWLKYTLGDKSWYFEIKRLKYVPYLIDWGISTSYNPEYPVINSDVVKGKCGIHGDHFYDAQDLILWCLFLYNDGFQFAKITQDIKNFVYSKERMPNVANRSIDIYHINRINTFRTKTPENFLKQYMSHDVPKDATDINILRYGHLDNQTEKPTGGIVIRTDDEDVSVVKITKDV